MTNPEDRDGRRTVWLGKELNARLTRYCRERQKAAEFDGPSASAVIRVALREWLDSVEQH